MRRRHAIIVAVIVSVGLILGSLAQVEGKTSVKGLLRAELTSIRQDVAHDRWGSAWTRTGKLNSLWGHYLKLHAVKKSTADNFAKNIRDLQAHLKQRSAAKAYVDLGALRAIVVLLKA